MERSKVAVAFDLVEHHGFVVPVGSKLLVGAIPLGANRILDVVFPAWNIRLDGTRALDEQAFNERVVLRVYRDVVGLVGIFFVHDEVENHIVARHVFIMEELTSFRHGLNAFSSALLPVFVLAVLECKLRAVELPLIKKGDCTVVFAF